MHEVVDKVQLNFKRKMVRYADGKLEPYGPDDKPTVCTIRAIILYTDAMCLVSNTALTMILCIIHTSILRVVDTNTLL